MKAHVNKYKVIKNITLFRQLILKGDILYIQESDPVQGKPQEIFSITNRAFLGAIDSSLFNELIKSSLEKIEE